jgi:hypothetical protein
MRHERAVQDFGIFEFSITGSKRHDVRLPIPEMRGSENNS